MLLVVCKNIFKILLKYFMLYFQNAHHCLEPATEKGHRLELSLCTEWSDWESRKTWLSTEKSLESAKTEDSKVVWNVEWELFHRDAFTFVTAWNRGHNQTSVLLSQLWKVLSEDHYALHL